MKENAIRLKYVSRDREADHSNSVAFVGNTIEYVSSAHIIWRHYNVAEQVLVTYSDPCNECPPNDTLQCS